MIHDAWRESYTLRFVPHTGLNKAGVSSTSILLCNPLTLLISHKRNCYGLSAAPVFATAADKSYQSLLMSSCLVCLTFTILTQTGSFLSGCCCIQAVVITGVKGQTCGIVCQLRCGVGPPRCITPLYFLCLPRSAACCIAARSGM